MGRYLRGRKFSRATLVPDAMAGLTVALVSIPEGMAYAMIAGVNPVYGLYTGMVSTIVASLTASTSLMVVTLTNALALVTADQLGPWAVTWIRYGPCSPSPCCPATFVFDMDAVQPDFAITLWKAQPDLLLIAVDLATNQALVLSSQPTRALTTEDLLQLIQRHDPDKVER